MRRAIALPLSLLAIALLLGVSLLAGAPGVEAQGSWSCTFDFTTGNHGWTTTVGSFTGSGIVDDAFSSREQIRAFLDVTGATITHVAATFTSNVNYNLSYAKGDAWPGIYDLTNQTSGTVTKTWTGSTSFSGSLMVKIEENNTASTTTITITSIRVDGSGITSPCAATNTPTPTPTVMNTPTPSPTATPATQTIVYDFRTGQHGWTVGNSVTAYSAGNGFVSTGYTTQTWGINGFFDPLHRRRVDAILCTENRPYVVSAELLVSITGASNADHNWSAGLFDGSGMGWVGVGNQDTGANLTRTITKNGLYANESFLLNFATADPPLFTDDAAFNADVIASSYTLHQISITYATGQTPVLCEGSTPPTVDITCPTGDLTIGYAVTFEETHTGQVSAWEWEFNDPENNTSTEADGDVEYTYYEPGEYTAELTVTGPGGSASDSCTITILRVGDPGGGGGALYRPIHSSDTDTTYYDGLFSAASGWFDEDLDMEVSGNVDIQHTVIGFTELDGKEVYAVADGTILDITPLTSLATSCEGISNSSAGGALGWWCDIAVGRDTESGADELWARYALNPTGVFRVRVSFADNGYLDYYVSDAPTYVREGQELLAGCIVGLTLPLQWDNGALESDVVNLGGMWLRAVNEDGDQWPILPLLYVDPDPGTACNAGGEYSDCLFDPLFQNQGSTTWDVQGGVSWADGVTLQPGASITMSGLNLDAATAYGFTVWTEYPSTYGTLQPRMTLSIGTTLTQFILAEHTRSPWTIASATHTADEGTLYSIRILNSGSVPFTALQNCVSTGEADVTPSACYFQNFSFDGQLTNWTTTGTVIPDPSGPLNGQIAVMSDLATMGQNVRLYADGGGGDHEYTVRLEGVLHAGANSLIQVRYRFGGGGWITPEVSGWTLNEQSLTALQRTHALEFDVPSATFAGVMEFQFDFTATGGDVIGDTLWLSVYSLCLSDAGGWVHHPGDDGTNWTPGTGCDNSAPPVEMQEDFGAWISYHLDGMSDIYYCDVIPQLERLNNVTYSIYEYSQWTGLYSQAAQAQAMTWVDRSLLPWLGGHLSNIAMAAGGQITTDVGGGCHDIFCVLDAIVQALLGPIINLVGRIVDTIIGLIEMGTTLILPLLEAVVGLFIGLINGLGGIINSLFTFISALVTGISNAQPAPVPGLPNCVADPSGSSICAVMYGLEQTVFADEGAAIIPLFIGILSVMQLSWLISKITELIGEVTGRI